MVRAVLIAFGAMADCPQAVILVRDLDRRKMAIKEGFNQVRAGYSWPFEVVFAFPNPEVEAWDILGFQPQTDNERYRLAKLIKALSFDPRKEPLRMTSRSSGSATDAKRIWEHLTEGDRERIEQCLSTSLDVLRSRGADCGLAAFLQEVHERLPGLFTR